MSLDNIKLGTEEVKLIDNSVVTMDVIMRPMTQEFVEALARKHPTWTFTPNYISRDYENVEHNGRIYSQVSKVIATEFNVMQGKDTLGRVGAEYWGSKKFTITNPRIVAQRERGSVTRTGDLKKAMKLVEKMFFPKTDNEIIKDLKQRAMERLSNHTRTHRYNLDNLWRSMQSTAILFVKENMEAYKQFTQHVTVDGLNKFDEYWDARSNSQSLEDEYNDGKACMVAIMNDTFFFSFKNSDPVSFVRDEVAPQVKTKVGMLKLLAVGGAIDNVGLKCEDDVFLISMMPNNVRVGV